MRVLKDFLDASTDAKLLHDAMLYSLEAGGKRLRPRLLLATLAGFDRPHTEGSYQVAASLEMIHTYSLIHDDLPAMDNDDLRRGKPTNHKVFGEAQAILAGDGLLTGAFELVSSSNLRADQVVTLTRLLAQKAGNRGMISGQVYDISAEQHHLTLAELKHLHHLKTGALIEFSLMAGGVLAEQSPEIIRLLENCGTHFGLAFQIRDDILDVEGSAATLGKTPHKDAAMSKNTYVSLLGLTGAKEALLQEITATEEILTQVSAQTAFNSTEILALLHQLKGTL